MGCSSSLTAPAWVPSTGCSPSGTGCSSVGPEWGHKSCQQTCSSMGFSLHRSTGPARSLLQHGLPMGSQPPLGIHLLWRGAHHGLQVDICPTMGLHGLQWDSLPYHDLLHRLQGKLCSSSWSTSCPRSWSTSRPPFFPDLGVCRVASLTYILTPLCCCEMLLQGFFPLLNNVIPEALTPLLVGLALASGGSFLEPAGIFCIGHNRSFWQLFVEATTVAPVLPKPCHTSPLRKVILIS